MPPTLNPFFDRTPVLLNPESRDNKEMNHGRAWLTGSLCSVTLRHVQSRHLLSQTIRQIEIR